MIVVFVRLVTSMVVPCIHVMIVELLSFSRHSLCPTVSCGGCSSNRRSRQRRRLIRAVATIRASSIARCSSLNWIRRKAENCCWLFRRPFTAVFTTIFTSGRFHMVRYALLHSHVLVGWFCLVLPFAIVIRRFHRVVSVVLLPWHLLGFRCTLSRSHSCVYCFDQCLLFFFHILLLLVFAFTLGIHSRSVILRTV